MLSVVTGVELDIDPMDTARTFFTNALVNVATAGIGNKAWKAILLRNLIDFTMRTLSDVVFGGQDIMWSAAVNSLSMLGSGILLAKYGKKLFGECVGRFGGCFVEGTQVVIGIADTEDDDSADSGLGILAVARASTTRAIEQIALGTRVVAEAPDYLPQDSEFSEPDPQTWRSVTLRQHRRDGAVIEMDLLRPQWWIRLLNLHVGATFAFDLPELDTAGHATVEAIAPCPPIEPGDGVVVIGRFVTRQASNLMTVTLSDGTAFTGTTTHPIWSADAGDWRPIAALLPGENIATLDGSVEVVSVTALAAAQDVFNIEVEGAHVYRLLESGMLVHNADYSGIIRNIQGLIANYPKVIDLRTGRFIPFPSGLFSKPGTPANPLNWTDVERDVFKNEWVARGFPVPAGGWSSVQIHHIHPREVTVHTPA